MIKIRINSFFCFCKFLGNRLPNIFKDSTSWNTSLNLSDSGKMNWSPPKADRQGLIPPDPVAIKVNPIKVNFLKFFKNNKFFKYWSKLKVNI